MVNCEGTSFMFPMLADVYHPVIEQNPYGGQSKSWHLDRTIAGNFIAAGAEAKEEIVVNIDLTQESLLLCRVKSDIRISDREDNNVLTNVLVTNIRDAEGNLIYYETDEAIIEPTVYEVATQQPVINPFGKAEYYRLILRRSENQRVIE